MPLLYIGLMIGIPVLYVLFSNPKTHEQKIAGRYSSIYKASIRDDYPPAEKVFKTLKDAGIKPCFLGRDADD